MGISEDRLRAILTGAGYLDEEAFDDVAKQAKRSGTSITQLLIDKDIIKDQYLGLLLADELNSSYIDLSKEKIESEILFKVPEVVARSKEIIAINATKEGVRVGMRNPNDIQTKNMLVKLFGHPITSFFITEKDFKEALTNYKSNLREEVLALAKDLEKKSTTKDEHDSEIVELVDKIFQYAYYNKASDIHIEPFDNIVNIRFRIDGVLHPILELNKNLLEAVLTRLKIISKLRTDEHRASQDGKLRFKTGDDTVDVRISIVPITGGENVVMRLLSSRSRQMTLNELGFMDEDLARVNRALKKPFGMLLVTGPTGSGKTTTVYEMMKVINSPKIHLSSIEDPVEYDIEGISQIQVNPKTNLTFAKGLRAIVRQDPDIIMVGEIRDPETAGIAVNSAMTGHLVLSTLHANDAPTTLPRLLDMGVEPFLVASTVNVIIAQRLIRKICESCRSSYFLKPEETSIFDSQPQIKKLIEKVNEKNISKQRFYKGAGCRICNHTGFVGRIGIFEILEMNEDVKKMVMERRNGDEIRAVAMKDGMTTLMYDGVRKAMQGITTIEEVLRVTSY